MTDVLFPSQECPDCEGTTINSHGELCDMCAQTGHVPDQFGSGACGVFGVDALVVDLR